MNVRPSLSILKKLRVSVEREREMGKEGLREIGVHLLTRELDQHLIDGAEREPLTQILVPALKNKILREGKEEEERAINFAIIS